MQSPAPGGGITPDMLHTEGWAATQHLCREGYGGGSYWTTNQPWASTAPLWQSIPDCFRKNTGSWSREADSLSLHRTGETTSGVPYPVLGCTVEERNGHIAASPAKGHKYEWRTGVYVIQGKTESSDCLAWKSLRGIFSVFINIQWESVEKREPNSSQWWPLTVQVATSTKWNVKNSIFYGVGGQHWNRLPREVV